jgi:hypothetical protein
MTKKKPSLESKIEESKAQPLKTDPPKTTLETSKVSPREKKKKFEDVIKMEERESKEAL